MKCETLTGIITGALSLILGLVVGISLTETKYQNKIIHLNNRHKVEVELLNTCLDAAKSRDARKAHRPFKDQVVNGEIWPAYSGGSLIRFNHHKYGTFSEADLTDTTHFGTITKNPSLDLYLNITHDKELSQIIIRNRINPVPEPNKPGYVIFQEQFLNYTNRAEVSTHHHGWLDELGFSGSDKNSAISLRSIPLKKGSNLIEVFIQDKTGNWNSGPSALHTPTYIPTRKFGQEYFENRITSLINSAKEKGSPFTAQQITEFRTNYNQGLDNLFGQGSQ